MVTVPIFNPDSEAVRVAAKDGDEDRYLAALLSLRDVRADLIALAAFSGEIARIPLLVKEPMMGEMRLQWWRDALIALQQGETTGNPVADAFGAAMVRHALPPGLVLGLLDARAFDLYPDPMPDEQTFRAYLAKTEGALFEMALRIAAGWPPGAGASVVTAAGQALGLTRVLAGLPAMLAKGRCALPLTRMQAAGLEAADLAATPLPESARGMLVQFHKDARVSLATVRARWSKIPRRQRAVLLPVALIEPQLSALEGRDHHPGRDLTSIMPLSRVWRIWRAHLGGGI